MNGNTEACLHCTKGELCEAIEELSRDLAAARRESAMAWIRCEERRQETYDLCIERDKARDERDAARREKEEMRETCARHIELIAADWKAAGAEQKYYAGWYLAGEIRALSAQPDPHKEHGSGK